MRILSLQVHVDLDLMGNGRHLPERMLGHTMDSASEWFLTAGMCPTGHIETYLVRFLRFYSSGRHSEFKCTAAMRLSLAPARRYRGCENASPVFWAGH